MSENLKNIAGLCHKPWKCTNPNCGRAYAEYVNGCPSCENKETGRTWSVKEQKEKSTMACGGAV